MKKNEIKLKIYLKKLEKDAKTKKQRKETRIYPKMYITNDR